VKISSKKYNGMFDMVEKKKRFPSPKARFCTEELKVKPMIDFILDTLSEDFITIQGIRKDESAARSKMKKQCSLYKNRGDGGVDTLDKKEFKIITLEGCGYCKDAKELFVKKGTSYEEIKEEDLNEYEKPQIKVFKTYPKIFEYSNKSGKYELLGGYKDLSKKLIS
jgi:glutaredoxin